MLKEILYGALYFFAALGIFEVAKDIFYFAKYGTVSDDVLLSGDFLDDVDAAVIVVLPNGKIRYINTEAVRLFPEYKSMPVLKQDEFNFSFENNEGEFQLEKDGRTFKVSVRKIIKRKRTLAVKLLITEISNLLYLEEQADRSLEENSRLLTNISHEIRTPLNAIIGAVEVIEAGKDDNGTCINVIKNEAIKVNNLLDGLLSASSREENTEAAEGSENVSAEGARALIVDDNKVNLMMAKQILEQYGVEADTVESGYACINLLENGAFYDIIFMDYMMEGMSGIDVTEYIRRLKGRISSVPIIAFTANSVEGAREMYLAAGMNDCLFKPAGKQAFGEMLRKYVPSKLLFHAEDEASSKKSAADYPKIPGIDYEEATKYSGGNSEVFRDILTTFFQETPIRINKIKNCLGVNDLKNFVVEVHGVKSQARTMGMIDLSAAMANLERAGIDGDYEYLDSELEGALKLYREWSERVRPIAEERLGMAKLSEGKSGVEGTLLKIHKLLEEFEMEDAENLFKTIWPGEYSALRQELMQKLKNAIEEIDYYASLDYVDKLLDTYSE